MESAASKREALETRLAMLKSLRSSTAARSQEAYQRGDRAEAKALSDEKNEYHRQFETVLAELKQLEKENKSQNVILITKEMEDLISSEYKKIQQCSTSGGLSQLEKLNKEYARLMKINYEQANISWTLGQKPEARQFSNLGKAYRIIVYFANESLKEMQKKNASKSKELDAKELKLFLSELNEVKMEQMLADSEEFRKMEGFFAENMKNCYSGSQNAWKEGNKELAKELSDRGLENKKNMQVCKKEAAKIALVKNNAGLKMDEELDLHGLEVEEAELLLDEMVQKCQRLGKKSLRVIVGKGLHSGEQGPKLRGLVARFADFMGMKLRVEEGNEGCFILDFSC